MIYMEEIMDTFKFPEFDMIAEDVVDKAVGSRNISDFSKANLERIARESGADIVIAMSLDKLIIDQLPFFGSCCQSPSPPD